MSEIKTPKVSVIMLAYNGEKYIAQAIEGVMRQKTTFPVQLVISDDCSTDSTYDICRRYAAKYPDSITLLRNEKNVGLQRNYLLAHAACRGEYVAMCDGDDYWFYRHKLQTMVDFMDANPDYAICFHRVINAYVDTHTKSLSNGGQRVDTTLLDLCRGNYITNCGSLTRRAYNPVYPEWLADITLCDYAMHLLNAQYGKIHYFHRPMAVYRQYSKATWANSDAVKRLKKSVEVREKVLDIFRDTNREAYDVMLDNYMRTTIALIGQMSINDAYGASDTEIYYSKIRTLLPDMDDTAIKEKVTEYLEASRREKPFAKKMLSKARAIVSFFIPLPNP